METTHEIRISTGAETGQPGRYRLNVTTTYHDGTDRIDGGTWWQSEPVDCVEDITAHMVNTAADAIRRNVCDSWLKIDRVYPAPGCEDEFGGYTIATVTIGC